MKNKTIFFNLKKSIALSWLLSYVMILVIPLTFCGGIYYIAATTINKEISTNSTAVLKQVQLSVDNLLNDIQKLTVDICFDPKIDIILNTKGENTEVTIHYNAVQFFKDYQRFNLTNRYIKNFYIYFKNSDYVLSPAGSGESKHMYHVLEYDKKLTYDQWLEKLSGKYSGNYLTRDLDRDTGNIAYLQSIPLSGVGQSRGTVAILIDAKQLREMLRSMGIGQSEIYIADKNNNILIDVTESDMARHLKFGELTEGCGILHRKIGGDRVAISYIASKSSGLKYITVTPNRIFFKQSAYLQRLMYLSILLSLLCGGVISIFLTKRNYNPVNEIVRVLFPGKDRRYGDNNQNEYNMILQAIHNTMDEKEKINKKLKLQKDVLRSNFLIKLMRGYAGEKIPVLDMLDSLDMHFKSENYAVILIFIEDFGKFNRVEGKEDQDEKIRAAQSVITNIFEELAGKRHQGYVFEIDEMQACLMNVCTDDKSNGKKDMLEIAQDAHTIMDQHFRMKATISLSNIHKTLQGIPNAYEEAYEAMEYKMVIGKERTIPYDGVAAPERKYFYPLETEQKLINNMKLGKYEYAEKIIREVFVGNISQGTLSLQMAKCLTFELLGTVIKITDEMNIVYGDLFMDRNRYVDELLKCRKVCEMEEIIHNISRYVCEMILLRKTSSTHEFSDGVKHFIENNYNDINLCIATIAEHFDLTPPYVSKMFREQTGEGLLDYINKIRLDKAKQLLKSEKLCIADVAVRVGYTNSNVFIRAFKKYQGITPGQYK